MNSTFEFDFMPMGLAIKNARKKKGLTREQFAEQLDITPRHLQSIEIEGQHPGFLLFIHIITMLDISADQYCRLPAKTATCAIFGGHSVT